MELELNRALDFLKKEKVILYPTDTVWGLGCDATNEEAVSKIYSLKQREESKSLIVLVDSVEMLKRYIDKIPEKVLETLENVKKPTTIIYSYPKGLAKNVIANNNTVAIRVVKNSFCSNLINEFDKPIVSTSANISGKMTPMSFKEINPSILDAVDYVVNLHKSITAKQSSRIIKIHESGEIEVLRD